MTVQHPNGLFITATGTDVGKTFVTTMLIRQLRAQGRPVHALKPLLSGMADLTLADSDSGQILSALGQDITADNMRAITPWTFQASLSPDMAARQEQVTPPSLNAIIHFCQDQLYTHTGTVLIEGVGGVMVPLNDTTLVADWIKALKIPALLVTSSRLGTISHTLTAVESLRARHIPLVGIIISEAANETIPLDETRTSLANFLPDVPIRLLPRLSRAADISSLVDFTDLIPS